MKDLKETIELMGSKDYKDRFIAEYWQLKIRYEKLHNYLIRIIASHRADFRSGIEEPKHDCPVEMLEQQENLMREYLNVLEQRAVIEKVSLEPCANIEDVSLK